MITAPNASPPGERRRRRHVSLGRRLEVLRLIHGGRISWDAAAALMDVSIQELRQWQAQHADDELVSLGPRHAPEIADLLARRRRLARLLKSLDASLRDLHDRLMETTRMA